MSELNFGNVRIINAGESLANATWQAVELYVDNINGDDSNDGTESNPLKTLAEAETRIPKIVNHDVIIHVLPYDASVPTVGAYSWQKFRARMLNARILVVGEGFQIVTTGTAQSGSSRTRIVTTGGMTVDEYVDDPTFIRMTSGSASGDIRTISENTADYIDPTKIFSDVVDAGDTYELLRPLVRCSAAETNQIYVLAEGTNPSGGTSRGPQTTGLFLVNLYIEPEERIDSTPPMIEFRNAACSAFGVIVPYAYGIFLKTSADFCAGVEQESLDFPHGEIPTLHSLLPSLSPNLSSCMGWGISFTNSIYLHTALHGFDGHIVTTATLAVRVTDPVLFHKHIVTACFRGGRCRGMAIGTPYKFRSGYVVMYTKDNWDDLHVPFKIRSTGALLVNVTNSSMYIRGADFGTTGSGNGISVTGFGSEVHITDCDAAVQGIGMITAQGGKIMVNSSRVNITGVLGDFSEDNGVTLRDAATLYIEGTYFSDWRVDPGTHAVTGTGAMISCP